jgi:Protein of unknown function (DUF4038)/Domain of unknown function (DUF5060)
LHLLNKHLEWWIFLLILACSSSIQAEKLSVIYSQDAVYKCNKWDVVDVLFEENSKIDKPFDLAFGVTAISPNGNKKIIPGFYDSGKRYLLRFNPDEIGKWDFLTYSDLKGLSGLSFNIIVKENPDTTQHGPVIVPAKLPGKFAYADGQPYFLQAFELDWLFEIDADNPNNIPKTKMLLDTISSYNFNQIIMNVYAYDVDWKKDSSLKKEYDYGSPDVYPFGGTNLKPDFTTLNVGFFRKLDRVIEYLDSKNIIAHLMIYVWNKNVNWPPMYSDADNRYFDYVVKRYEGYPNIIWDISKEALSYGRCDMNYVNDRIRRIRKLDAYKRLLTVHDYRYCERYPDKVDFISIQYWGTDLYEKMLSIEELNNGEPVFNIEHGGYERGAYKVFTGDYTDPTACLWRNYQCAFAGVYSTYYWQNTAWNVIIPDPMKLPEDKRPHFDYYKYFVWFFKKHHFENLQPVKNVSSSGWCLQDKSNKTTLFLIPKENSGISITLNDFAGKNASMKLFNPLNGKYTELPDIKLSPWFHMDLPEKNSFLVLIIKVN